jgi:DDE superfamily endonuclease
MWCVADLTDEYLTKMEEVLEVYERPYNPAEPVVCLDEKPVSLHDDVRPARPMAPGKLRRPDNEYKRCGTANVYCAVEPKAGVHFTLATPNRSAPQFAQAMETIIASYPNADTIHLVMDNLNIHGPKSLTDHFGKEKGTELWNRLTVHYTPVHGSWLNQAEIEISLFARQCLRKRRIPTLAILQRETKAWTAKANHDCTKIDWQFTRKKARTKFRYKPSKRYRFTRSKT